MPATVTLDASYTKWSKVVCVPAAPEVPPTAPAVAKVWLSFAFKGDFTPAPVGWMVAAVTAAIRAYRVSVLFPYFLRVRLIGFLFRFDDRTVSAWFIVYIMRFVGVIVSVEQSFPGYRMFVIMFGRLGARGRRNSFTIYISISFLLFGRPSGMPRGYYWGSEGDCRVYLVWGLIRFISYGATCHPPPLVLCTPTAVNGTRSSVLLLRAKGSPRVGHHSLSDFYLLHSLCVATCGLHPPIGGHGRRY